MARVLDILDTELASALALVGCPTAAGLDRSYVTAMRRSAAAASPEIADSVERRLAAGEAVGAADDAGGARAFADG